MMLFSLIPNTPASAIWAMMAACGLPFIFSYIAKGFGGFGFADNAAPREFFAKLTGLPARADAVQKNSFETLPMFLASVLLAMLFFVPQMLVNQLAWLYVVLRVLFGLAYLLNWATIRSILWVLSMFCVFLLFYFSIRFAV